jgi:nucleotide-binding universal stress UspA family protein
VSQSASVLTLRRILVALDASPHSLAALETAVRLAANANAELLGLFVEDAALLRAAEIPLARELSYFSAESVPVSREGVELKLRAQSRQIQATLARAAEGARIASSFRCVRGNVAVEISSAAGDVDLLVLGRTGWSVGRRAGIGSTALEIAAGPVPVLLLPERGIPEKVHLVVYFDASKSAERALRAARELAEARLGEIAILAPSGLAIPASLIQPFSANGASIEIRTRSFDASNEASLLRALKAERDGVLVVGSRDLLHNLPPLQAILCDLEMPVLLLGPEPANP